MLPFLNRHNKTAVLNDRIQVNPLIRKKSIILTSNSKVKIPKYILGANSSRAKLDEKNIPNKMNMTINYKRSSARPKSVSKGSLSKIGKRKYRKTIFDNKNSYYQHNYSLEVRQQKKVLDTQILLSKIINSIQTNPKGMDKTAHSTSYSRYCLDKSTDENYFQAKLSVNYKKPVLKHKTLVTAIKRI